MKLPVAPARPRTPAQHGRHDRVLAAATALVSTGGVDALLMKQVAEDAAVSLATVYRYFPSKDHVLLAIARARFQAALARVEAGSIAVTGRTPAERVTEHLLREFAAQQRQPLVTSALVGVLSAAHSEYRDVYEEVQGVHLQVLGRVGYGAVVPAECRMALRVVAGCFGTATRAWIVGVRSAEEARFEIRLGCRLLDVPTADVLADLDRAGSPPTR